MNEEKQRDGKIAKSVSSFLDLVKAERPKMEIYLFFIKFTFQDLVDLIIIFQKQGGVSHFVYPKISFLQTKLSNMSKNFIFPQEQNLILSSENIR